MLRLSLCMKKKSEYPPPPGDDLLNPNFKNMVIQINSAEFHLIKASSSDTEALFLDLDLSITNGIGWKK